MHREGHRIRRAAGAAALAGAISALALGAFIGLGRAQAVTTLAGTIASSSSGTIVLTTPGGARTVRTTTATNFIRRSPASLADIKPRDFIGVDATKSANGELSAVSINIFPPAWEGKIREGQWLMTSGDTMTNAVVASYVTGVSGRILTMTHQGSTWKITVPPSTSIHRLTPITIAALRPQMHAMVRGKANADGSVTATSVSVDAGPMP